MRLYDIAQDLYEVINGGMVFDEETGEVIFDCTNLDALQDSFDEKLEACGIFVKNLNADITAMKDERRRLTERIDRDEKKVERLKSYISDCMSIAERDRISTAKVDIGKRKSYAVSVDDEKAIPYYFKRTETVEKINKSAILKLLKEGKEIEGASLEERRNIIIR